MEEDEAENYELQRYISATEACARLLEIPLQVSSHGVKLITFHLPGEESVPVGDGAEGADDDGERDTGVPYVSMLHRYFLRPCVDIDVPGLDARHMDDVTVREYFENFNHAKTLPASLQRVLNASDSDSDGGDSDRPRRRAGSDSSNASDGIPGSVASHLGRSVDGDGERARAVGGVRGRGRRGGRGRGGRGRGGRGRGRGGRGRGGRGSGGGGGPGRGRSSAVHRDDIWQDQAVHPQPVHWVWPKSARGISRLPGILPTQGQAYYLRLLLLTVPARDFDDLLVVDGTRYDTFKDAAVARGLVRNGDEAATAMRVVAEDETSTPSELRYLYGMLLLHGDPNEGDALELFRRFWRPMALDITNPRWRPGSREDSQAGLTDNLRKVLLLRRVNAMLDCFGKCGEDFGLPNQADVEAELTPHERALLADVPSRQDELRALQSPRQALEFYHRAVRDLTPEQRVIVDYWVSERQAGRSPQIFIDALAGRGKTHVMRAIAAWERSQEGLPLSCAYTGIVAAMHLGGMTAHRLFGLPITSSAGETAGSSISRGSEKGQLLAAGSAIIVDEAFMLRCDCGGASERAAYSHCVPLPQKV